MDPQDIDRVMARLKAGGRYETSSHYDGERTTIEWDEATGEVVTTSYYVYSDDREQRVAEAAWRAGRETHDWEDLAKWGRER